MRIQVALAATLMLAAIAPASAAGLEVGQSGRLTEQAIACPTVDGLMNLLRERDQWKAGKQAIVDRCVVLDKGDGMLDGERAACA